MCWKLGKIWKTALCRAIASCDNGFVSFMIMGEDGETGTMTVSEGLENKITLKEGDFIGIINAESEDSALLLTAR